MKKIRKMLLGALTVALLGAVGCFTACKGEDSSFDSTESVESTESVVHTHFKFVCTFGSGGSDVFLVHYFCH